MGRHESHGHDEHPHHVRDALSPAGDASEELLATLFTDIHHETWEDAVRRYESTHAQDAQP